MMKLSVLLLPAVLALSSASLQDIVMKSLPIRKGKAPFLNPDLGNRIPQIPTNGSRLALLTPAEFEDQLGQSSTFMFSGSNLEWQTWSGSVPNGAISIYNGYVGRTDYVCKYGCSAGFFNPSKGPYCHYPLSGVEHWGSPFQILVNKDNFEILEWKEGSWGSVPENSVQTCSYGDIYVGRNKYGLGKVHVKHEAFFLPWEGDEYWYKHYQVLTINKLISKEHISDVKYKTDAADILQYPPEVLRKSSIINNGCSPVVKTLTLSKTVQVEKRWDTSAATTASAQVSITASIPFILDLSLDLGFEQTVQFSSGTTTMVEDTFLVSVEQTVPPNHSCGVSMMGYRYKANIPYKARLSRTYRNGETTWTRISGTYSGVNVGEVRSVADRCEPLPNAKPCPCSLKVVFTPAEIIFSFVVLHRRTGEEMYFTALYTDG